MKQCTHCHEIKSFSEFWRNNANPTGYESHCIACKKRRYQQVKVPRRLPVGPLVDALKAAEARGLSHSEIAQRVADRSGREPLSVVRTLNYILAGDRHYVRLNIADEIAIALGMHIDNIWRAA